MIDHFPASIPFFRCLCIGVMGGLNSSLFGQFENLCYEALVVAREHVEEVICLMDILTYKSNYPAFKYNPRAKEDFRDRMLLHLSKAQLKEEVAKMMQRSFRHAGTGAYDTFQVLTNGIAK